VILEVKSGSCQLYPLRKAVLLTDDGEHELEHETGQSFHGQTPLCEGEAVLQLHFRNGHASFTETWRQKHAKAKKGQLIG
jgi:hypothetical protein